MPQGTKSETTFGIYEDAELQEWRVLLFHLLTQAYVLSPPLTFAGAVDADGLAGRRCDGGADPGLTAALCLPALPLCLCRLPCAWAVDPADRRAA